MKPVSGLWILMSLLLVCTSCKGPAPYPTLTEAASAPADTATAHTTVDGRIISEAEIALRQRRDSLSESEALQAIIEDEMLLSAAFQDSFEEPSYAYVHRQKGLVDAWLRRVVEEPVEELVSSASGERFEEFSEIARLTLRRPRSMQASHILMRSEDPDDAASLAAAADEALAVAQVLYCHFSQSGECDTEPEGFVRPQPWISPADALHFIAAHFEDRVPELYLEMHVRTPVEGEKLPPSGMPEGWTAVFTEFSRAIHESLEAQKLEPFVVASALGLHLVFPERLYEPVEPTPEEVLSKAQELYREELLRETFIEKLGPLTRAGKIELHEELLDFLHTYSE